MQFRVYECSVADIAAMSVRRENTFRIDYANVPRKPSFEELHDFVATTLGLQYEQVVQLQPSRALGCAFVKVVDLELARRIVAEHDNKHETEVDGKIYKLRITLEDGAVEVKLTDLSEDITNEQVAEFLSAYGEVLTITNQVWDSKYRFAGLPTGARIARMMVKRNIKSYVTIDGQTTNVTYFGQLQTCKYCSEFVHNGISCVQNKKLLVQKTYANVAKEPAEKNTAPRLSVSKPKPTFAKLFGPKPGEAAQQKVSQKTKRAGTSENAFAVPKPTKPNLAEPSTKKAGASETVFAAPLSSKANPDKPLATAHALSKPNPLDQTTALVTPPVLSQNLLTTTRMVTRQAASDGNETDISTASTNSKRRHGRPPGKKLRHDDDTNEESDNLI